MDSHTISRLISGFTVRAASAAAAIYVGLQVAHYVADVFGQVNSALTF